MPPSAHVNSPCERGNTYSTCVHLSVDIGIFVWRPLSSSSPAADQMWLPGKPAEKPCHADPSTHMLTLQGYVREHVKLCREKASPSVVHPSIFITLPRHPSPPSLSHKGSATMRARCGRADPCVPRQRVRPLSKSSLNSSSPSATEAYTSPSVTPMLLISGSDTVCSLCSTLINVVPSFSSMIVYLVSCNLPGNTAGRKDLPSSLLTCRFIVPSSSYVAT
mmetsp:Transcript_57466/g.140893  ORF Transcript_57466/g.140893 Transcript_57466/m.140893 type:complete len:220 (-) Transcript_57466:680-1339(-)